MNFIIKISKILTNKNKKFFLLIVCLSIFKTFIELISIGSLVPILVILSNSDKKNQIFIKLPFLEEFNESQLLLTFIIFFIIIYLIKTIFLVFLNIFSSKFSHNLYKELSESLLNQYLNNKFIFFVQNNSSSLVQNIASETSNFAIGTVGACITIISNIILFFGVCILLISINYNLIYFIIILLFLFNFIVNLSKIKLNKLGQIRLFEAGRVIQRLNEVIGSIKEILLYNKKLFFINQVKIPVKNYSDAAVYKDAFTSIISPIIEFISVIIFFIFFLYLFLYSKYAFSELILIFGVFTYATIKLLPNLIVVARLIQTVRFNLPAVDMIYNNLIQNNKNTVPINNLNFNHVDNIVFKKVNFTYPQNNNLILKNINLKINKGDKIGIIGETGSGKTTLVNLIAGLLLPTKGKILINSKKNFYTTNYNVNIGYVSQSVYLFDDNIITNISLSNEKSEKNIKLINSLLEILNLNNFNNKKKIYRSLGERGLKISGGQIQRIGIARALYRRPTLLILDEATNAIDEKTENKILNYLFKEFEDKIIIFCTHKKKLLKYCNKIIEVKSQKAVFLKK
jgi:ATP-binding cassette subfamily B protein